MNTLYYKHEITPVFFFSQPPQQQSYTKDPQGGVWRPGKPQISVSCPRVEFVLLWSSSARSWDDVAVSLLCHSLFSQHKGGGGGGKHDETCPKTKSIDCKSGRQLMLPDCLLSENVSVQCMENPSMKSLPLSDPLYLCVWKSWPGGRAGNRYLRRV